MIIKIDTEKLMIFVDKKPKELTIGEFLVAANMLVKVMEKLVSGKDVKGVMDITKIKKELDNCNY